MYGVELLYNSLCKLFGYLKPKFNKEYISDYLKNQALFVKENRLSLET
jgi:hypothetical protein